MRRTDTPGIRDSSGHATSFVSGGGLPQCCLPHHPWGRSFRSVGSLRWRSFRNEEPTRTSLRLVHEQVVQEQFRPVAPSPISPDVSFRLRPDSGKRAKLGTIGYMVMAAAVPVRMPAPADAMQAAPIDAIDAVCRGAVSPRSIRSAMEWATTRPMTPDGMPVRGGAGEMTVPSGVDRGREIG